MRESKRKGLRREKGTAPHMDSKQMRAAFIINMFREFPDREFSLKQLVSASGGNSKEARYLVRDLVDALVEQGVVDRIARDKFQLSTSQLPHYEGTVDMVASGAAYVKVEELESDIYVNQRNVNYALEGDRVEVVLQRQALRAGDNPEGAIIKVLERSNKQYVGVAEVSRAAIFVRPDARRLPMDVFFPRKEYPQVKDGDKVVFRISEWHEGLRSPRGVITDVLGPVGDNDTEMHAILAEYDLPYRFDEEVEGAAQAISGQITERDYAERRDFRNITTFTIDPVDAKERMGGAAAINTDIPENIDIQRYLDKMTEVRILRDSISRQGILLDEDRNRFAMSEDDRERSRLTSEILRRESAIPKLQDSLDRASAQLQKIEMEFLFSGVVIDPDKVMAAADREVVGEATSYTFTKMSLGDRLELKLMDPPVVFDYTFKILPEGQFALDNTIPDGIVYQIQIFSSGVKATVKSLKGLSPVFERKNASGNYIYRVGLFNSYKDVLSRLNQVKRAGFRSAFIVAYIDGQEVSVSKARTQETQKSKSSDLYEVRVIPTSGELDGAMTEGINQQSGGKDIAKIEGEEGVTYIIGPYAGKSEAEKLAEFIRAMGIGEVTCNAVASGSRN